MERKSSRLCLPWPLLVLLALALLATGGLVIWGAFGTAAFDTSFANSTSSASEIPTESSAAAAAAARLGAAAGTAGQGDGAQNDAAHGDDAQNDAPPSELERLKQECSPTSPKVSKLTEREQRFVKKHPDVYFNECMRGVGQQGGDMMKWRLGGAAVSGLAGNGFALWHKQSMKETRFKTFMTEYKAPAEDAKKSAVAAELRVTPETFLEAIRDKFVKEFVEEPGCAEARVTDKTRVTAQQPCVPRPKKPEPISLNKNIDASQKQKNLAIVLAVLIRALGVKFGGEYSHLNDKQSGPVEATNPLEETNPLEVQTNPPEATNTPEERNAKPNPWLAFVDRYWVGELPSMPTPPAESAGESAPDAAAYAASESGEPPQQREQQRKLSWMGIAKAVEEARDTKLNFQLPSDPVKENFVYARSTMDRFYDGNPDEGDHDVLEDVYNGVPLKEKSTGWRKWVPWSGSWFFNRSRMREPSKWSFPSGAGFEWFGETIRGREGGARPYVVIPLYDMVDAMVQAVQRQQKEQPAQQAKGGEDSSEEVLTLAREKEFRRDKEFQKAFAKGSFDKWNSNLQCRALQEWQKLVPFDKDPIRFLVPAKIPERRSPETTEAPNNARRSWWSRPRRTAQRSDTTPADMDTPQGSEPTRPGSQHQEPTTDAQVLLNTFANPVSSPTELPPATSRWG